MTLQRTCLISQVVIMIAVYMSGVRQGLPSVTGMRPPPSSCCSAAAVHPQYPA